MVLIAIDKHSRKILGYLCKNDQTVAYCCSECDVEFTTSSQLEHHMVRHEKPTNRRISESIMKTDDIDAESFSDSTSNLSESEKENLLKIKYQVVPCSVLLNRHSFDHDNNFEENNVELSDMETADFTNTNDEDPVPVPVALSALPMDPDETTESEHQPKLTETTDTMEKSELNEPNTSVEAAIHTEPIISPAGDSIEANSHDVPTAQSISSPKLSGRPRGRRPKKRPDTDETTASTSAIGIFVSKRRRMIAQKNLSSAKKVAKPRPPPAQFVCFLCGNHFQTSLQLAQHERTTHFSRAQSPVFPCNICHQNVKNLKMHLRQHKKESKINGAEKMVGKAMKLNSVAKSNGSSKFNGLNKSSEAGEASKIIIAKDDSKVTKEEASSSTDAVVSTVLCNKEQEIVTSNEALQSNSDDSTASFLSNDKQFDIESSLIRIVPLSNLIDEYPPKSPNISDNEPISVNEPSQSTQRELESIDLSESEENGIEQKHLNTKKKEGTSEQLLNETEFKCGKCSRYFESKAKVIKHQKKHDKKVNCKVCGKLLACSYVKTHIKFKHPPDNNIPLKDTEQH